MEEQNKADGIRVLVVDDEPGARGLLEALLGGMPAVQAVSCAATALDAVRLLNAHAIDLVVLDIEMPGGSGLDLLASLPSPRTFDVVFATSHGEYALQAIPWRPFGYLLKPIDPDELARTVDQVVRSRRKADASVAATILELHTLNERHFVTIAEITHLESDGAYTLVHLVGGKSLLVSRNLGQVESRLPVERFYRCHRSFTIALEHVRSWTNVDGGQLVLANGRVVPLASRKHAEFEARMQAFQAFR